MVYKSNFILIFYAFLLYSCSYQEKPLIAEGSTLTLVSDEYKFTEGPASDLEGNVYFTDQPNDRILKWNASNNDVALFMHPAGRANGLYFDSNQNLLACADEKFELWKIDAEKNVTVLVDNFEGKKLNGPNDLWINNNDGIYFTDPYYQRPWWERKEGELEKKCVFYLKPDTGELQVVAEDFIKPNGIIGSSDRKIIYVADRGANKTYSYQINEDGGLTNKKLFIDRDSDGMTLDNRGNLYVTGENGVVVFNMKGEQILQIPIDKKWTSNVTFGGIGHKTLFITAMNSVYTLKMNVKGARW